MTSDTFFCQNHGLVPSTTTDILTRGRIPLGRDGGVKKHKKHHNGLQFLKKARKKNFLLKKAKKTIRSNMKVIVYICIVDIFGISEVGGQILNVKMFMVVLGTTQVILGGSR
jgi:hypothetical protein